MNLRKKLRARLRKRLNKIKSLSATDLSASAIVFSPHQDDETLGCGGTIIRKREAGAEVRIVFMTDGSRSHDRFIPEKKLIALRRQEAVKAAECLGLRPENVWFLDFRDGELADRQTIAIERVRQLLLDHQPQQVFIPYVREAHPDHLATNEIVFGALASHPQEVAIYEYPVWYWHHFPWTANWGDRASQIAYLKASIKAKLGWQAVQEFDYRVDIESIRSQKQLALSQHHTQMERLVDSPDWGLLKDVADGEWLECFFQPQEIFRRTIIATRK